MTEYITMSFLESPVYCQSENGKCNSLHPCTVGSIDTLLPLPIGLNTDLLFNIPLQTVIIVAIYPVP